MEIGGLKERKCAGNQLTKKNTHVSFAIIIVSPDRYKSIKHGDFINFKNFSLVSNFRGLPV